MIDDLVKNTVNTYLADDDDRAEWNMTGLREYFMGWLITEEDLVFEDNELEETSKEDIITALTDKAKEIYQDKENEYGKDIIRELERVILLKVVDTKWMAHIDDMEEPF